MTEYINEAQALTIKEIVENALNEARETIAEEIGYITQAAKVGNPFKVGDKVVVSADAKCFNYDGSLEGGVFFGKEVVGTVVNHYWGTEGVEDEQGNVRVETDDPEAGDNSQVVAPQFLTAFIEKPVEFKVGDKVAYDTDYFLHPTNAKGTGIIVNLNGLANGKRAAINVQLDTPGVGVMSYEPSELTLLEREEVVKAEPVAKFAVGDKLVIDSDGILGLSDGKTITVTEVKLSPDAGNGGVADKSGPFYYISTERQGGVWEAFLKPAPVETVAGWAEGDRVLVDGEPGTIVYTATCCCCVGDIEVDFDNGDDDYIDSAQAYRVESLDEREFVPATTAEVGDELILIDSYGDGLSDIKVGEKVTVTNYQTDGGLGFRYDLVTAVTADGRKTSRYTKRFAHA